MTMFCFSQIAELPAPLVYYAIRSHNRAQDCKETVALLQDFGVFADVWVSPEQVPAYQALGIMVQEGVAGCCENTQAILRHAWNLGRCRPGLCHVVIFDDNQKRIRLANAAPNAQCWHRFMKFAWSQLLSTGASAWSAFPTSNTYGREWKVESVAANPGQAVCLINE